MFFRSALILCASAALAAAAGPVLTRPALVEAAMESAHDNIRSGWCGRGMLSILKNAGLGQGLSPGNGQDWEKILLKAGWKSVRCFAPERAPLGSVLVYSGDRRVGKIPRGTPGGYYGHVEMVALSPNGGRLYVADSPRAKPGGSVPDNFTGRAWLPPGTSFASTVVSAPVPVERQVEIVFQERRRMALAQFGRKGELAALQTSDRP